MTNIVTILNEANHKTLVLFDELGAGTDPVEGAALAVSIIEQARGLGAKVAATTHYAELKVFALNTAGVQNGSCEFDVDTLRPTYRLMIGIPGRSNAFAISSRLGLDDGIIDKAKTLVDKGSAEFEAVIEKLEGDRKKLEGEKDRLEYLRREVEVLHSKAAEREREFALEKQKAVDRAKAEAQYLVNDARQKVNEFFEEMKKKQREWEQNHDVQSSNDTRSELNRMLNQMETDLAPKREETKKPAKPLPRPLKLGDTVYVSRLDKQGSVSTLPDKDGKLNVKVGVVTITVKQNELTLVEDKKPEKNTESARVIRAQQGIGSLSDASLDLRGMAADEAIVEVDLFLDRSLALKLNTLTIVHGKGTGILRNAITQHLRKHKLVKSSRLGKYGEGESGVTIVELK